MRRFDLVHISRYLAIVVVLLGVVGLALGIVFIVQGMTKSSWVKDAMRIENLTFGIEESAVAEGEVADSTKEAQTAADTVREHRRGISPTYQELLGEGRYDPTNPKHLNYAQALNLENYLYLAVLGLGVIDVVIASGVFMIVMGIALGGTGVALFGLARVQQRTSSPLG
jgi:hypothetical protein